MSNTKNTKTTEESKKQPNALLTFAGEQDVEFFGEDRKAVFYFIAICENSQLTSESKI